MISRRLFLALFGSALTAPEQLVPIDTAPRLNGPPFFCGPLPWHDPRGPPIDIYEAIAKAIRQMPDWPRPVTHVVLSRAERERVGHLVSPNLIIVERP